MKSLFLINILLALTSIVAAQSISFTYAPDKQGSGVIIETPSINQISLLGSYDSGNYKFNNTTIEKYGIGIKYDWFMFLYQSTKLYGDNKHEINYFKHSFELGGDIELSKKIRTGMLYDPLNRECRLLVTVRLK